MPGHQLTQSQYALQQTVVSFGNLLFPLEELHLTHLYHVIFDFCELENIRYLVLSFFNTGELTFKETSKELLFNGEV